MKQFDIPQTADKSTNPSEHLKDYKTWEDTPSLVVAKPDPHIFNKSCYTWIKIAKYFIFWAKMTLLEHHIFFCLVNSALWTNTLISNYSTVETTFPSNARFVCVIRILYINCNTIKVSLQKKFRERIQDIGLILWILHVIHLPL